jgi:Fur family zinc uptake transcriptional regulator
VPPSSPATNRSTKDQRKVNAAGASRDRRKPNALDLQLNDAQQRCVARGGQLTALRREVLRLLLQRGGTAKAYDLQDDMRIAHGRVAPMTVYRALDFLMQMGLVHRVDALNTFVVCTHHDAHGDESLQTVMLACTSCGEVREEFIGDESAALAAAIQQRLAFHPSAFEVKGLCEACLILSGKS